MNYPGPSETIVPSMTVREVLSRHPALERVFDRHGLGGCGGPNGPLEPEGFFALAHKVDPTALVEELNIELGRTQRERRAVSASPVAAAPAQRRTVYSVFMRTSIALALSFGFGLGVILLYSRLYASPGLVGPSDWVPYVQVHGTVQLYGWIGLFIMGVALHILPRFKGVTPLRKEAALAIWAIVLTGLVARLLTLAVRGTAGDILLIASGVALLAGSAAFATAIFSTLRRSTHPAEGYEPYLAAAGLWLIVSTAAYLAQMVYRVSTGLPVVPDAFDEPVLHAYLLGFAGMFTMGISQRILPVFLGTRIPPRRAVRAAFLLVNAGLAVRFAASLGVFLLQSPELRGIGWLATLGESAGLLVFAVAASPWRKGDRRDLPPGAFLGFEKFIRTAYVWLVLAAVLEAGLAIRAFAGQGPTYFDASVARHALALGFLTLMATGFALRIVPVFGGTQLALPRWANAAFWLLLTSVSLRVAFTLVQRLVPEVSAAMVGASGFIGLIGLGAWSASLWATLNRSGTPARHRRSVELHQGSAIRMSAAAAPATPASEARPKVVGLRPTVNEAQPAIDRSMTPAEVVERYPDTLAVFASHGFEALRDEAMRNSVGRSITIERAGQMHGVAVETLLEALNAAARGLKLDGQHSDSSPAAIPASQSVGKESPSPVNEPLVWMVLKMCYDPELPVNIVDLGLVHNMAIVGTTVRVDIGLTNPACPVADQLGAQVQEAVQSVPGVEHADVRVRRDLRWSPERMSAAARQKLGWPSTA